MLARASTKTFVSRVRKTAKKIFVSRKIRQQGHSLAEVSLYSPETRAIIWSKQLLCMHEKLIISLPYTHIYRCRVEETVTVACNLTTPRNRNFKSYEQFVKETHLDKPEYAQEHMPNHTTDRLPFNALKHPWIVSVSQVVSPPRLYRCCSHTQNSFP